MMSCPPLAPTPGRFPDHGQGSNPHHPPCLGVERTDAREARPTPGIAVALLSLVVGTFQEWSGLTTAPLSTRRFAAVSPALLV